MTLHHRAAAVLAFASVAAFNAPVEASQRGIASHYSTSQRVACGGALNPQALTAAHRTLPCGARVQVTNLRNGRSVIVRINDRGPFTRGRIIDVTPAAARALGFSGLVQVSVRAVGS